MRDEDDARPCLGSWPAPGMLFARGSCVARWLVPPAMLRAAYPRPLRAIKHRPRIRPAQRPSEPLNRPFRQFTYAGARFVQSCPTSAGERPPNLPAGDVTVIVIVPTRTAYQVTPAGDPPLLCSPPCFC